jgi:RNA polymerase sigma factor (sigma-70 family)
MTRTGRPAGDVATATDLLAVAEPVRTAVRARLQAAGGSARAAEAEDVVQETLARVWEVRWRLERETLLAYGLVVARNLVTSAERQEALRTRYGPRLVEPATAPDPEAGLLAAEEHAALLRALAAMRATDRSLLVEHEVHGVGTGKIAAEEGVAPNTVAVRLARARARLRVEHLLALRGVTLPTAACRGVLEAISLGDRGRQRRLLAAEHLAQCTACAGLADPLLTRRRSLTGLAPVAVVLAAPGRVWGWARAHPAPASGAGAATAAVAVTVGLLLSRDAPAPAAAAPAPVAAGPTAATPATLSVGGTRLLPADRVASLRPEVGRAAVARDAPVQSVPADEGFWVGAASGQRVWVQLKTAGESPVRIRPGQRVSFTGVVVRAPDGMPREVGLTGAEGAAELTAEGAYVLVGPGQLTVR